METGEEAGKKGDQGGAKRAGYKVYTKGELEDCRWLIVTGRERGHMLLERKHFHQTVSEVNKYSVVCFTSDCSICM